MRMKNPVKPEHRPLTVEVYRGQLIISIGIETLAFASVVESTKKSNQDCYPSFLVKDATVFADEVCSELNYEEEDGTTVVHTLLDEAIERSIDKGNQGVALASESKENAKACKAWDIKKVSGLK